MLELRTLSPALKAKAQKELNETDDLIRDSITALREWLSKQPHINGRNDEQFLLSFLRGCKYSLEKTKKKIDTYYTARTQMPQYFKNRDIHLARTLELIRKGYLLILPNPIGEDGPRVILFRTGCYDTNECSAQDMMIGITLLVDLTILLDDQLVVSGCIVVTDMAGFTMNHLLQYDPVFLKRLVYMFQDASPGRIHGAYYINVNGAVETFVSLVKSLMSQKLSSRVHIISTESLYQHVPQKILPTEYGGEAGTIEQIANGWIEKIKQNETLLKEENSFNVDESKRPGKPNDANNMFGTDGSFRTLNVD